MALVYALVHYRWKTPLEINPLQIGLAISLLVAAATVGFRVCGLW
jgi:hypothetical protein